MKLAFYGHTSTIVFTYTKDEKFNKQGTLSGLRPIYDSVLASISSQNINISHEISAKLSESKEYRRDYYGVRRYEDANKKEYYGISRYLGYEDGEVENNIFSATLGAEDAETDTLFVFDAGYGGLCIPEAKSIVWISNKVLPDKEQFEKIAAKSFLFLDGSVLRKAGAMISRQISWERTVSELISEIQNNPKISYLLKARQLFINFDVDGAVFILPNGKTGLEASLMLTHGEIEGSIGSKRPNQINDVLVFSGMALMFVTSVAFLSKLIASGEIPVSEYDNSFNTRLDAMITFLSQRGGRTASSFENAMNDAVKYGCALRAILETGDAVVNNPVSLIGDAAPDADSDESSDNNVQLKDWPAFPIPLMKNDEMLEVPKDWTVINSVGNRELYDVAFEYVQHGAAAIEGLPRFALGGLTTVDRWEIESYQNIRNLILDYANTESSRPLNIAVFGSPGSGKSFGVTQIATNVLPGKIEKLEFNVSQFVSPMDLGAAFQKVRDCLLEGKLPLVFFDEFDSDKEGLPLGWVKSFLMPMQDGRFRDESGEHPLGKCILVFAGGTASNFESFVRDDQDFKNAKGPDFISRLRGTINVVGPNPKDDDDKNHILRRALLLRSLCERDKRINKVNGSVAVNPDIIRAMLTVPKFHHGARSMEAILAMSRIEGGVWEPTALPFHSQLALHVDAGAFLGIV